jgi:phosphoglycolate phosphatase
MTESRFRHVVFDLDGTLADTAGDIANAGNHVRSRCGLQALPVTAICDFVGDGARQLVARLLPGVAGAELDTALEMFLSHYEAHILDETTLYPGIDTMLSKLNAAGVTCSVLSNKPAVLCQQLVNGLGVSAYFVAVLGGDSLPAKKPDPCGIQHLRKTLDLRASEMMLVGDSPIDRETARAGSVAFCGVAWGFASAALAASDGALVAAPDEIVSRVIPAARPVK